jgi:hypothetical protein
MPAKGVHKLGHARDIAPHMAPTQVDHVALALLASCMGRGAAYAYVMANNGPSRRSVLGLLGSAALLSPARAADVLDLSLVLAIDCSLSVDDYDYRLQLRGTGQAMIDSALLQLIERGPNRVIAVSAFLWSGPNSQQIVVPWRVLHSGGETREIADEILSAPRKIDATSTATGNALAFAEKLMRDAPPALRRVVDVSTNGHANMGDPVSPIRDRLVQSGITINGLAVTDKEPNLVTYMQREVTGGDDSFVVTANDYNAYTLAIRLKLFREIAGLRMS